MRLKNFNTALVILATAIGLGSCDKQPIGPTEADPIGPSDPTQFMTLTEFRSEFVAPPDITIPAGTKKIRGVVISNSANEAAGNYRLQDESGTGLYLYSVQGSPVYSMGSILEINPVGGQLILYNGDQELKSVPQANVVPVSGAINITPRVATIAQINSNRLEWASSLVKINGITSIVQTGSNATGKTYTITDPTGSLTTFVRETSGITLNTSATSLTGYVSIFNSNTQVQIRTAADVQ